LFVVVVVCVLYHFCKFIIIIIIIGVVGGVTIGTKPAVAVYWELNS
jgi:hypothetical protein